MESANSMVNGGWGDPLRDHKNMKESFNKWKDMKRYWDKGPKNLHRKEKHLILSLPRTNQQRLPQPLNPNINLTFIKRLIYIQIY